MAFVAFVSEQSPWQQHGVNSGVRLPNDYTYTKLEKVLPITSKDNRDFIDIIYYSWINKVNRHLICIL